MVVSASGLCFNSAIALLEAPIGHEAVGPLAPESEPSRLASSLLSSPIFAAAACRTNTLQSLEGHYYPRRFRLRPVMTGLLARLEAPAHAGSNRALDNADLRATPPSRRTWGFFFFASFWFAAVSNVSNWVGGSTWLALGITFWEGVGCATAGYAIVSTYSRFQACTVM